MDDAYQLPDYVLESYRFMRAPWRTERVDGTSHFMMLDRPEQSRPHHTSEGYGEGQLLRQESRREGIRYIVAILVRGREGTHRTAALELTRFRGYLGA